MGGWTVESAEVVCNPRDELDILESLSSLVDQSLVRLQEDAAGEPRFGILETVREYALERLEASGETLAIRRRHAEYYVELAEQAEPELTGRHQLEWLYRLETEHDNLRAVLKWSRQEQPELMLRLVGALWRFWFLRGYFEEWERWVEHALAIYPPSDAPAPSTLRDTLQAKVLFGRAVLAQNQDDAHRAAPLAARSLTLYRTVGDRWGMVAALAILGWVDVLQGEAAGGRARLAQSLDQAREVNDPWLIVWVLYMLGTTAWWEGDYGQAAMRLEESLPRACEVGDRWLVAKVLWDLGRVAEFTNDNLRARMFFEESLVIQRQLEDKLGMAYSLAGLVQLGVNTMMV